MKAAIFTLPRTKGGRKALRDEMRWRRKYGPSPGGADIGDIDWDELDREVREARAEIQSYGEAR